MARVSTYLNFPGTTEQAFLFYKSIFGGEFIGRVARFKDAPADPNCPLSEAELNKVLHIEIAILGGHILMGTDAPDTIGMNGGARPKSYLNLEPDSKEEADRLFHALALNATIEMPIQAMFWGAYYGCLIDQFGVGWMVNYAPINANSNATQ